MYKYKIGIHTQPPLASLLQVCSWHGLIIQLLTTMYLKNRTVFAHSSMLLLLHDSLYNTSRTAFLFIGLLVTIYHKFYISTFKYFTELHVVGEGYCHSAASATTEVEAHMAAYYALYSY